MKLKKNSSNKKRITGIGLGVGIALFIYLLPLDLNREAHLMFSIMGFTLIFWLF